MLNDLQSVPDPISNSGELENFYLGDKRTHIFSQGAHKVFSIIKELLQCQDSVNKMSYGDFMGKLEHSCPESIVREVCDILRPEIWIGAEQDLKAGRGEGVVKLLPDIVVTIAHRETVQLVKSQDYAALQPLAKNSFLCDNILLPSCLLASETFDFSKLGIEELCDALLRGMQCLDADVKSNALQIARKAKENDSNFPIRDNLFKEFCSVMTNDAVKTDGWALIRAMWLIAHTGVTHSESLSKSKMSCLTLGLDEKPHPLSLVVIAIAIEGIGLLGKKAISMIERLEFIKERYSEKIQPTLPYERFQLERGMPVVPIDEEFRPLAIPIYSLEYFKKNIGWSIEKGIYEKDCREIVRAVDEAISQIRS